MKNKGRRHKSGNGPFANGNCKGCLCGITRDIRKMAGNDPLFRGYSKKWMKRKWQHRLRGYLKSQTKEIF